MSEELHASQISAMGHYHASNPHFYHYYGAGGFNSTVAGGMGMGMMGAGGIGIGGGGGSGPGCMGPSAVSGAASGQSYYMQSGQTAVNEYHDFEDLLNLVKLKYSIILRRINKIC